MPLTSSARRRVNKSFRGEARIPNVLQGVARPVRRTERVTIQPVGTPVRLTHQSKHTNHRKPTKLKS